MVDRQKSVLEEVEAARAKLSQLQSELIDVTKGLASVDTEVATAADEGAVTAAIDRRAELRRRSELLPLLIHREEVRVARLDQSYCAGQHAALQPELGTARRAEQEAAASFNEAERRLAEARTRRERLEAQARSWWQSQHTHMHRADELEARGPSLKPAA